MEANSERTFEIEKSQTVPPIATASVRILRSHDYCHFEVALSTTHNGVTLQPGEVDELRKTAARLADKAVEQYKIAKENAHLMESDARQLSYLKQEAKEIYEINESERTPEQQARLKTIEDRAHFARRRYDYEDQWGEPDYPEDDE